MISNFPLWTFYLYVGTFQQHLHIEYIYLRWYGIPELVVPIRDCWSHHFESFTVATMTWLTVMEYLCHKWPAICSWSFPHSWLITEFVTRLTRRVPPMEQELLTLPQHLSSPPVFSDTCIKTSQNSKKNITIYVYTICYRDF